ncbi:MAG: hypothetical protein ACTHLA_04235 [Asticcacaulis sp.]|uniref:hypothetical protein n=1 Tax=Asticcacaulis sp. TaxID=1872648 RepID=UPI003F7B484A
MTKTQISAAAIAAGLVFSGAAFAQTLNDPAQLQREHQRAVAANDPANDPYNPQSSNRLNQQQLQRAQALGDEPVYQTDRYDYTAPAAPPVAYNNDSYRRDDQQALPEDTPPNITVVGPTHAAPSSFGQPDTSPQSTGTPMVDTPYATTQPAPDFQ